MPLPKGSVVDSGPASVSASTPIGGSKKPVSEISTAALSSPAPSA
tara:strand:+ start:4705 stop:4839 length:135 start_codon:yes stop_codon:yes gene_type:complete